MVRQTSLRAELNALREELARLTAEKARKAAEAPAEEGPLHKEFKDIQALAQSLLDDAEETVADHPVAAVAGALALGLVIGRLSCR
jgi:ElaB/YqjD/DUF883 family membrane-anchored ribosome-binding protein